MRIRACWVLLLTLCVLPVKMAHADDRVVFGGSVEVKEGEVIEGDLVIFGGSARIHGKVEGDTVVFGGKVVLEETGVVEGDLVTMGGSIDRRGTVGGDSTALGAESGEIQEAVDGALRDLEELEELENLDAEIEEQVAEAMASAHVSKRSGGEGKFWKKLKTFLLYCHIAYMALIAVLILLEFNPERILNITRTVEIRPGRSLLAGTLTLTAFVLAFVFFFLSMVGLPIAVMLPFVLGLVGFPGVMGMCGVIARKLPLGRISGSTGAWLLGALLMTLLPAFTYWFIGPFLFTVLFSLGLGAGVMSRFGRREPAV
jgi:hypothetical protein